MQTDPAVAMAPDGTFIVTWTSTPIPLPDTNPGNSAIFGREYTAAGVPIDNANQPAGFEFQISPLRPTPRSAPDAAMDANDDFVVVWEGDDNSTQWGLYGDYFYANGKSTGAALLNDTPNTRSTFTGQTAMDLIDTGPRVGMNEEYGINNPGGFVVTWADYTSAASGYDVYAQQFAPGDVALAAEFMVNQTTAYWQLMPAVAVDPAGNFTIVWTSYGQDNAEVGYPGTLDYGVYCRMYNANGTPFARAGGIPHQRHDRGQPACPRGQPQRPQRRRDHRVGGARHGGGRHDRNLPPQRRSADARRRPGDALDLGFRPDRPGRRLGHPGHVHGRATRRPPRTR